MPIKKSRLEKKWFYRLAKAAFWLLPLLTIVNLLPSVPFDDLESYSSQAMSYGIVLAAYLIGVPMVWRIILYIAFGGIENDTTPSGNQEKESAKPDQRASNQETPKPADKSTANPGTGVGVFIFFFIIIMFIVGIIGYSNRDTTPSDGSQNTYSNPGTTSGNSGTTNNNSTTNSNSGTTNNLPTISYCSRGNTYNYSSGQCCPNETPHYYNGVHGYSPGCYASCPYIGDCSAYTTRY